VGERRVLGGLRRRGWREQGDEAPEQEDREQNDDRRLDAQPSL
ncbi:MAG: hypothetical protein AVDCRST_MAG85-356, partial [uncultured Solirubrobacteraceae bacterium]